MGALPWLVTVLLVFSIQPGSGAFLAALRSASDTRTATSGRVEGHAAQQGL